MTTGRFDTLVFTGVERLISIASIKAPDLRPMNVCVFGRLPITDGAVDEFIEHILSVSKAHGPATQVLSYVSSSTLTASHRRKLAEKVAPLAAKETTQNAIISSSAVTRMAMNTVAILMKVAGVSIQFHAVSPGEMSRAIDWLRIDSSIPRNLIEETLKKMMLNVGYPSDIIGKVMSVAS